MANTSPTTPAMINAATSEIINWVPSPLVGVSETGSATQTPSVRTETPSVRPQREYRPETPSVRPQSGGRPSSGRRG